MSLVSRRERLRKAVELPNDPCVMSKESETETPQAATEGMSNHSPDAWREDFIRWALDRCALRDDHEDSQSVGSLLIDFGEWCAGHDAVPAPRDVFEALVQDAGFQLKDGLAAGIVLKVDLEAVLCSQAAPETSGTPARQSLTGAGRGNPQNPQNSSASPQKDPQPRIADEIRDSQSTNRTRGTLCFESVRPGGMGELE
jgi:hypothetical protein